MRAGHRFEPGSVVLRGDEHEVAGLKLPACRAVCAEHRARFLKELRHETLAVVGRSRGKFKSGSEHSVTVARAL